jgi:hypothetical protein
VRKLFSNFRVVPGDPGYEFTRHIKTVMTQGDGVGQAVQRATTLVEAATDLFSGTYPLEAPEFALRHRPDLAWFEKYHDVKHPKYRRLQIDYEEFYAIAEELFRHTEDDSVTVGHWTRYSPKLFESPQSIVQGFAVEVLLAADRFFDCASEGRIVEGLPWLCGAQEALGEAACAAQATLYGPNRSVT